jgi:hypothetical protein
VLLGTAAVGLLVGVLWLCLAPRVPLYADNSAVYLKDPEGEQPIGQDGWFALLGLAAGLLTAVTVFWCTRRRGGGVAVALGLALGGLLGSVAAWRLGVALGPTRDLVAHARQVRAGTRFDGPLEIRAKSALLVWPTAATVTLLALTAVLTSGFPRRLSAPDALPDEAVPPLPGRLPGGPAAPERPAGGSGQKEDD